MNLVLLEIVQKHIFLLLELIGRLRVHTGNARMDIGRTINQTKTIDNTLPIAAAVDGIGLVISTILRVKKEAKVDNFIMNPFEGRVRGRLKF